MSGIVVAERSVHPTLVIENLQVHSGAAHVLKGVSLSLDAGVLAVIGDDGLGKTTLCNAIVGLHAARSGSIRLDGREITGASTDEIHRLGVGYAPRGRRGWPSLTLDEQLRLPVTCRGTAWTTERIYQTFEHLAERRDVGGAQLSTGEQQMLAIARALLSDPRLLVIDHPTEGLAPHLVDEVRNMLVRLGHEADVGLLVIEANTGVATGLAGRVAVLGGGRIERTLDAAAFAADRDLQGRAEEAATAARAHAHVAPILRVERGGVDFDTPSDADFRLPQGERDRGAVLVAGTFDTKTEELRFLAERVRAAGLAVRTVDLSTSGRPMQADVTAAQVAASHPGGVSAVLTGARGAAVTAMSEAFARWIAREPGVDGIISAGGSGGTALATPAMRNLPIGTPKLMVSTVASGDVREFVGGSDILMMHSVADVQGLNSITEAVLTNAAHAIAGMVARLPSAEERAARRRATRPAVGLTMFGVTTPAVQALTRRLEADHDCLVFHATGVGGRAMEALADARMLACALDITTTEVADMLVGGVLAASPDRFGAFIRTGLPWIGSVGACDMVNFGARATVPAKFDGRLFVVHNPQVTLMRTTPDECRAIGQWIAGRLNLGDGPVRMLLPEGGVSALDAPGQPFFDDEARAALFEAIERTLRPTPRRRVERVGCHINAAGFTEAALAAFRAAVPQIRKHA